MVRSERGWGEREGLCLCLSAFSTKKTALERSARDGEVNENHKERDTQHREEQRCSGVGGVVVFCFGVSLTMRSGRRGLWTLLCEPIVQKSDATRTCFEDQGRRVVEGSLSLSVSVCVSMNVCGGVSHERCDAPEYTVASSKSSNWSTSRISCSAYASTREAQAIPSKPSGALGSRL